MLLKEQTFIATTKDSQALSEAQCQTLMAQLPDAWQLQKNSEPSLQASFNCDNFVAALAAAKKITALAEDVDHHPVLVLEYGKITVTWWSHELKGLHANDFLMALRTSECLQD